jgi:perosamine synthetase
LERILETKKLEALTVPYHVAAVGEEEASAAAEVIRSGWLTTGPRTMEFEKKFAEYVGAKHAVSVASCTAGLHLAYDAIHLKAGDEVLVPAVTFTATAETVVYLGATPVIVDVDPLTLNLSVADAARKITPRTRAIVPVHYAGQPCDMAEIQDLAGKHGLEVIEDAAHSLPASYRGTPVGTISRITCFSFYATKTLAIGEGGMVTTPDDEIATRIRMMRLHGIGRDSWKRYTAEGSWFYEVLDAGFKYNMTDVQSAIGLVQLGKCDALRQMRASIAASYDAGLGGQPWFQIPTNLPDRESGLHLYPLRLHLDTLRIDRGEFIRQLKERGIGTSVHFIPLHLHPFYRDRYGYKPEDLPVATREYQRYLSLPFFPSMSAEQIDYVIESAIDIARSNAK